METATGSAPSITYTYECTACAPGYAFSKDRLGNV